MKDYYSQNQLGQKRTPVGRQNLKCRKSNNNDTRFKEDLKFVAFNSCRTFYGQFEATYIWASLCYIKVCYIKTLLGSNARVIPAA